MGRFMKTDWKQSRKKRNIYYFDSKKNEEIALCAGMLHQMIGEVAKEQGKSGVVFLCIGTDRSTGDSLGPLIGYKLKGKNMRKIQIMGTLERPVHAMNLDQSVMTMGLHYPNHVIVAVDASVGYQDHVGCITLGRGALRPGLGVSKELPEVGDIFITGIVGGCGNYDPLMLQSVRLSVVMRMADYICESAFLVEQFLERAAFV